MMGKFCFAPTIAALILSSELLFSAACIAATGPHALITAKIDPAVRVTLGGNIRPEANANNDRGAVDDALPLDHILLQLRRSSEAEAAMDALIDALHNPVSTHYHKWLEPEQIGAEFGPAAADIDKVKTWLTQQGFTVNTVYAGTMMIDFSGTAGQVRSTFHTELHHLDVKGMPHIANIGDASIPAALAPVVFGIVKLHDFDAELQFHRNPKDTDSCYVGTCYDIVPGDLATIYNFKPLFAAGITGKGQTVAAVESGDVAAAHDWSSFRSMFGLSSYTHGTLAQTHPAPPTGVTNCSDPGVNGAEDEAILDAEYASAAAPDAHIILAACPSTTTAYGFMVAALNLIAEPAAARPHIINVSYGICEANFGAAANAAIYSAFKAAVAEGISVYVSSGDQLTTGCDRADYAGFAATNGMSVNGVSSTAYAVAVGGSDFSDVFHKKVTDYWSSTNAGFSASAKSYIPEIPWNSSCANKLLAVYVGFTDPTGPTSLCASSDYAQYFEGDAGGSGGISACAKGVAATAGVVSGTCSGWARPSWQVGVPGLPTKKARVIPDVALFASFGPWNHSYVVCSTDLKGCVDGFGGTSFAAPIMAGIQALINQKMKVTASGNPNVALYKLAATEYGNATQLAACNSTKGNASASTCIFHDITEGGIESPCQSGTPDCYPNNTTNPTYGVTSTSTTLYRPAYNAEIGWDYATGLGSVNVANLVNQWHTVAP